MTVTVLLADDHPIVRQGLRRLLDSEPDFQVVGEASDGQEALQFSERYRPDVLVVDLMMPVLNGLEVLRQIKLRSPKTRALVLSMQNSEGYIVEALRNGALGYLLKDSAPTELVQAIKEVVNNRRYLSPRLSEKLIDVYLRNAGDAGHDPYDDLTNRERELLQMVAESQTSAEIASRLCISRRTVEIHRANILHKLGLHSQTDVIRYALRRGILSLEE